MVENPHYNFPIFKYFWHTYYLDLQPVYLSLVCSACQTQPKIYYINIYVFVKTSNHKLHVGKLSLKLTAAPDKKTGVC